MGLLHIGTGCEERTDLFPDGVLWLDALDSTGMWLLLVDAISFGDNDSDGGSGDGAAVGGRVLALVDTGSSFLVLPQDKWAQFQAAVTTARLEEKMT